MSSVTIREWMNQEVFRQNVSAIPPLQGPTPAGLNVRRLPVIELHLQRDVRRDEPSNLVWIDRSGAGSMNPAYLSHSLPQRPASTFSFSSCVTLLV